MEILFSEKRAWKRDNRREATNRDLNTSSHKISRAWKT
jgi:hypothetical protein